MYKKTIFTLLGIACIYLFTACDDRKEYVIQSENASDTLANQMRLDSIANNTYVEVKTKSHGNYMYTARIIINEDVYVAVYTQNQLELIKIN